MKSRFKCGLLSLFRLPPLGSEFSLCCPLLTNKRGGHPRSEAARKVEQSIHSERESEVMTHPLSQTTGVLQSGPTSDRFPSRMTHWPSRLTFQRAPFRPICRFGSPLTQHLSQAHPDTL